MQLKSFESLSLRRLKRRGRTPLLVTAALVLAIGVALCVLYKPWNFVRYGRVDPPLPTGTDFEPPLSERITERVAQVRAHPYDAAAWGQLGETYDVHEIYPQANVCYERAQRLAPEEPRWPYLLGIAQRIGDQRAALVCFERVLVLAPNWAAAHFYAGHGYLAVERPDDAAREFQRALELEHEAPAALIGLANVMLVKQEPNKAIDFLERAIRAAPKTKEARWYMAAAWRALGDEAKAQTFAGAGDPPPVHESFPDELSAKLRMDEGVTLAFVRQRAELLLARGEKERAIHELQLYVEKAPKSVDGLIALADLYMRTGSPEEAISRYQAACTLDPTQGSALAQWGVALAHQGQSVEAIEKLRQALALEPARVEFKFNLGGVLSGSESKEERAEGLSLLGEAAQARPLDATMRMTFARALGFNERIDEAVAGFQRALELAPDDSRMRFEFAVLCARAGRMEEAAAAFARVVEAEPAQIAARMNLIQALTELGRHREAIAAARSALEIAPKSLAARSKLAWMLATSPDDGSRSGTEALAMARELTRETEEQNPEFMVIRAAAEAESGDVEAAQKTVQQTLDSLRPKPPDLVTDPALLGIIDQALACQKAFKEGKAFRTGLPK